MVKGPLFGKQSRQEPKIISRPAAKPEIKQVQKTTARQNVLPKTEEVAVEKKSFFKSKKFIASAAILAIAVIAIVVIILMTSNVQQEAIEKAAIIIPFLFRNKKRINS